MTALGRAIARPDQRLALRAGIAAALDIAGEIPFDDEEVIIDRLMLNAESLLLLFAAYVRQRKPAANGAARD